MGEKKTVKNAKKPRKSWRIFTLFASQGNKETIASKSRAASLHVHWPFFEITPEIGMCSIKIALRKKSKSETGQRVKELGHPIKQKYPLKTVLNFTKQKKKYYEH